MNYRRLFFAWVPLPRAVSAWRSLCSLFRAHTLSLTALCVCVYVCVRVFACACARVWIACALQSHPFIHDEKKYYTTMKSGRKICEIMESFKATAPGQIDCETGVCVRAWLPSHGATSTTVCWCGGGGARESVQE